VPNFDIGVISTGTCPGGAPVLRNYMDDEDSPNYNNRGGWFGAIGSDARGTTFAWCRVDGRSFWPTTSTPDQTREYAVLMMGTDCPNGSRKFSRYFDNEDSRNQNWPRDGSLGPNNVLTLNTYLSFCLFRSGPTTMAVFPTLGVPYGVFAPPDYPLAPMDKGFVTSDDEFSSNANGFIADPDIRAEAARIIQPVQDGVSGPPGARTNLFTARVSP
jgi:hypothetical protein